MSGDIQPAVGHLVRIRFPSCVTRRWVHKADIPFGGHAADDPCSTLSFGFPFGAGNRIFSRILCKPRPFVTRILNGWISLTILASLESVHCTTDPLCSPSA